MPLCNVSFGHRDVITGAINQLLAIGVISEASYHTDRYDSSVFATEKPDRSLCMILNLKHFNVFVHHVHFKMESLQDVICLIQPGVWMGSVDLKDAVSGSTIYTRSSLPFIYLLLAQQVL